MSEAGADRGITLRGLAYRVRVWGDPRARTPVVFLHGFAGDSGDWMGLAGTLADSGHAAVAVDLPGHGLTEPAADASRYTVAETVCDLGDIPPALGAGSAHWVGYSMGGRLALLLAAGHPERVASLVLESASPGIEDEAARADRRVADEGLAAAIEARGMEWFVAHWASQPIFATQRALPPAVLERQRSTRLAARPSGLAASLRGAGQGAQPWLGDRLGAVACPTLLVTGGQDPRYTALAARMAAALPRAAHVVVPAAGHNVHLEQPAAFERALRAHLERAPQGATVPAPTTS